ncbi:hypothetical protein PG991_011911 [Apiospora marii]|uniref:Uncharacterized protein n=1 Tax=Apiospora marii TaxID=335849 RepID=A0ABR1RFU1_9PEZI
MADDAGEWHEPLASDVARYSDAELDDLFDESKRKHGMCVIDVSDPDNLPDSSMNRLSPSQARVDLDQVTARLLETSTPGPDMMRRDRSPPAPLSPPESAERRHYEALIRAGGRPCYPIEELEDVMNDPRAYREALQPWVHHADMDPPGWEVFQRQLSSWEGFRAWQNAYRDGNSGTAHPSVDSALQHYIRHRSLVPRSMSYIRILQRFQSRHRVREDATNADEQDRLSTWFDYIAYMVCLYAQCLASRDRLQTEFDRAWSSLQASVALELFETLDYIRTRDAKLQQDEALLHAARDFEGAKLALSKLSPSEFDSSDPETSKMRIPATKRLLVAAAVKRVQETQAALDLARERDRHFVTFYLRIRDYEIVQDELERLLRQMDWASDQALLIEAEEDQLDSAGHDEALGVSVMFRYAESGVGRTKKRDSTDDGNVEDGPANKPRASEAKKRKTQPEEPAARC